MGVVLADVAFENTTVTTHAFGGPIDEIVVRSDDGDGDLEITARGARSIDTQTDSGPVRVNVPRGEYAVSTKTDSGDVKLDAIMRNDRAQRSIEAHTDSGDVTLSGAGEPPGPLLPSVAQQTLL